MVNIKFKCTGYNKSWEQGSLSHVVVSDNKVINFKWPHIELQLNSIIYIDNVCFLMELKLILLPNILIFVKCCL